MMHLYSALLCIVVHQKRFTIMWGGGGGSLLNHHQCAASTWMMRRLPQDNSTSALTKRVKGKGCIMASPCLAAATLAPDSIGYLIGNKLLRQASSAVYVQHSRARLIYDRHFMLELRKVRSSGIVDTITLDTLHSLGLLCLPDPAAYEAAVCPTDTGCSRRRRRRCDRKWKRGSRGGLTAKLKANPCRTPLPSILLANVRSVENKLDYLKLDLTTKQEMRDCCTIILTETWLNPSVSDDAVSIEGLTIFRSDRRGVLSGKSRGWRCVYLHKQ